MEKDIKTEVRIGTIAWHQSKIDEIRSRNSKPINTSSIKTKAKEPQPRHQSKVEYDFLKYVRVVFKWAVENYPELTRPEIEFLLYLYGIGAFSKKQFNDYHKLLGLYSIKTLQKFEDTDFIHIWRVRRGNEHALYTLTQKSKILCNKMHRYSCGVDDVPTSSSNNKMIRKDAPRINNYYLDMIKRMNKDKS